LARPSGRWSIRGDSIRHDWRDRRRIILGLGPAARLANDRGRDWSLANSAQISRRCFKPAADPREAVSPMNSPKRPPTCTSAALIDRTWTWCCLILGIVPTSCGAHSYSAATHARFPRGGQVMAAGRSCPSCESTYRMQVQERFDDGDHRRATILTLSRCSWSSATCSPRASPVSTGRSFTP